MNAGAVRNSSNHYLKSYAVVGEEPLPASEELASLDALQAEIDSDTGWTGDAALDSYSEELSEPEARFSVPALIEELRRQESELSAQVQAQPEQEAGQDALQSLQSFIKRLIPLSGSEEMPSYLMDEYLLLQADLGKAQLELQTSAQTAGPLGRIERLSADLEAALAGVDLEAELRQEMEALLPQLGKAKGSLELASTPETAAQAEESVEELILRAEEIVGGYQENHQAQRSEIQAGIEELEAATQNSEARGYYRLKVAKKLVELKTQFEEGTLPLNDISQGLKDLEAQLQEGVEKTAAEKQEKADQEAAYRGLAGKIPMKIIGSDYAQELAARISRAMENGKWGPVYAWMYYVQDHDDATHTQSDFTISLVVGALFYGPAGESEEKLKKLLDALPKKVREEMIRMVELNDSDWRGLGLDTETARRDVGLYGTTNDTIALLKASLK